MYISRNSYLEKLKQSIGNGMIKIITGPRRAGKSFLLFHIFKDYLLSSGIKDDHIIEISLDDSSNTEYRNPIRLDSYFKDRIKDKEKYYFLSMKFNSAEASTTLLLMVLEPLMERYRKSLSMMS